MGQTKNRQGIAEGDLKRGAFFINNDRVKTLGNPVTIIEAQGPGTVILPRFIRQCLTEGVAYGGNPTLNFSMNGSLDPIFKIMNAGFVNTETVFGFYSFAGEYVGIVDYLNKPFVMYTDSSLAGGSAERELQIYMDYYIWNINKAEERILQLF